MIKVIVTDSDAQETGYYGLDLSTIKPDTTLYLSQFVSSSYSSISFFAGYFMNQQGSVAVSNSYPPYLQHFSTGSVVGPGWNSWGSISSASNLFGSSVLGGFRVYQGSGYHTYGWFNATINGSSSFTLNSYGYNLSLIHI